MTRPGCFSSLAATHAPRVAPTVNPIEDQKVCVIKLVLAGNVASLIPNCAVPDSASTMSFGLRKRPIRCQMKACVIGPEVESLSSGAFYHN